MNYAMCHARGAACLITDADCRVPDSWVSGMASELGRVDLIYGTFRLWDVSSGDGKWLKIQESQQRVKWGPGARKVFSPVGASMGFKWVIGQDIGGFAENGTGEDADFGERALKCGWVVSSSLADHARVQTKGTDTYSGFVRQALRWRNLRPLKKLLRGSWPGWDGVRMLGYSNGVSLAFLLWTAWCLVTGNWIGLGLGILGVVGVEFLAYGKPLINLVARSKTRLWAWYFLGWVVCMLPVRLCETPYVLTRLVRGVEPVWERVH